LNGESHDVGNLLKVLSFLDPENIPLEMVVHGAKEWLRLHEEPSTSKSNTMLHKPRMDDRTKTPLVSSRFHSLTILITSPIKFQTALQKLQSLSLIERRSDGGTSSLWMHDLIEFMMQDAARKE